MKRDYENFDREQFEINNQLCPVDENHVPPSPYFFARLPCVSLHPQEGAIAP